MRLPKLTPRSLRWMSLTVGTILVVVSMVLGATWADLTLTIGAALGLAFILFWFEQQWEQRVDEITVETDQKIERISRNVEDLRSTVLGEIQEAATEFVDRNADEARQLFDAYLATPTPTGLSSLLARLDELGLPRPSLGQRYATSADPDTLAGGDTRLGYIGLSPATGVSGVVFDVVVRQPVSGGGRELPKPPPEVRVRWGDESSVTQLMTSLMEKGLPGRAHLWTGAEEFSAALTSTIEYAGQSVFEAIQTQSEGNPANPGDDGQ